MIVSPRKKKSQIPMNEDIDELVLELEGVVPNRESMFKIAELQLNLGEESGLATAEESGIDLSCVSETSVEREFSPILSKSDRDTTPTIPTSLSSYATPEEEVPSKLSVDNPKGELQKVPHILSVGESVLAKWEEEDGVWYNAEVIEIEGKSVSVVFLDYGNTYKTSAKNVVKTFAEIPIGDLDEDLVDENVSQPTNEE